ncbi:MAG: DUF3108 domain-containing protein, partial [Candidatus Thioglobus sp.]|nr:DUF3108 domain-containing protein [Candidatus Thioglobus sp.]
GINIAKEIRTLHELDNQYFYTANAETSGVLSLIKDYSIAASSIFSINDKGVDGVNYQIMEQENGKVSKNRAIDISSKNNTVISILTKTQPKIITWKAEQGNIVDPLSLFLAISYDLTNKPNQKDFYYQVANGKSVKQHHYQKSKNVDIKINNRTFKTIKVDRMDSTNNKSQIYYLTEYRYLPVIIKQTKGSKKYLYKIKDFKISEVEKLQVTF